MAALQLLLEQLKEHGQRLVLASPREATLGLVGHPGELEQSEQLDQALG